MNRRIGIKDFDVVIGGLLIHVMTMTATINDAREVAMDNGIPNGYVDGECTCDGSIELDAKNLALLTEAARSFGSWRAFPPQDIVNVASAASENMRFSLYGCLLNVADLFSNDAKGGEKAKTKIDFKVTSPDFVHINGLPYLDQADVAKLFV